jgi:GMP synthase-like glutamine amidotransferase
MCEPLNGEAVLASSARCPVQAVRVGQKAYGLQFHAEITDKSIVEWSADYAPDKGQDRVRMLGRYREVREDFHRYGRVLCENFMFLMKGQ